MMTFVPSVRMVIRKIISCCLHIHTPLFYIMLHYCPVKLPDVIDNVGTCVTLKVPKILKMNVE